MRWRAYSLRRGRLLLNRSVNGRGTLRCRDKPATRPAIAPWAADESWSTCAEQCVARLGRCGAGHLHYPRPRTGGGGLEHACGDAPSAVLHQFRRQRHLAAHVATCTSRSRYGHLACRGWSCAARNDAACIVLLHRAGPHSVVLCRVRHVGLGYGATRPGKDSRCSGATERLW